MTIIPQAEPWDKNGNRSYDVAVIEPKKTKKRDDGDSDEEDNGPASNELLFGDMTRNQKVKAVIIVIIKLILFLTCLYVFICSLGLLESSFQLLGGKTAGEAFSSGILSNPLAGLMIGVLATVLVQSSSTSSSIVVTMVGSNIIPIKKAVPIVMGANIGTSVTNTVVSMAQASNRKEFRRAFAGATVHDMFNWLAVIVLLPIEIAVGYLYWLSGLIVDSMGLEGNQDKTPDMLKAITKPVIDAIVEINKDIIKDVAANANSTDGDVLQRWCETEDVLLNTTIRHEDSVTVNCQTLPSSSPLRPTCDAVIAENLVDSSNVSILIEWDSIKQEMVTQNTKRCDNLFAKTDLDDSAVGGILLVISLALLMCALFLIVKILNSMLSGSVSKVIKKSINSDFPYPFAYFTGYVAMLVGVGMTIVVQSSSVFTSTLTPLVGIGIVSVERMYPMTLGSNVGTTVTAILAALSQSGQKLRHSMQIAMCHLFFNISGILLFYPLPFMRWPIGLAKILGKTTSKYRWFALVYLIAMFIVFPGTIFALSYAGWIYLGAIGGPIALFFFIIAMINVVQTKRPSLLPKKLQNWDFLPLWCHSLQPADRLIERVFKCKQCQNLQKAAKEDGVDISDLNMEKEVTIGDDIESNHKSNGGLVRNGLTDHDMHKVTVEALSNGNIIGTDQNGSIALTENHTANKNTLGVDNNGFQDDNK